MTSDILKQDAEIKRLQAEIASLRASQAYTTPLPVEVDWKARAEAAEATLRLAEYVLQDDLHNRLTPRVVEARADKLADADIDAVEKGGKRWHGTETRTVSVRWEPYKPDGQRQMKAKGRWQEQVGSGDYWRWQNCDRPAALSALKGTP